MSSRWSRALGRAFALRVGLWYAALFAFSTAAVAVVTYALLARALASQDHDVLASMLDRYSLEYQRAGLVGLQNLIDSDAGEGRHERLLVRVINSGTQVIYFAEPPGWGLFDLSSLDDATALREGWTTIDHPPDGSMLEVGSVQLTDGVVVQVGRSSHVRDDLLLRFRQRALEVLAVVVLVGVGGGMLLTHFALTPLRALEATVRGILTTGRLDARVETRNTSDPLDELGGLVNQMLSRIQTLVGGMRGALDNVAHDLRTPLTRLRAVAEAALIDDDPVKMRDGLARALEEAERVNATLTALMDISEAETGTMSLQRVAVRVAALIGEAEDLYADEAEDKGIALTVDVPPDLQLVCDRTRCRQVLANLIENAVKYTERGGQIAIAARSEGGDVVITVRDTGRGVAPSDLPFIWDRLYRGDASRASRGVGLGLSLVKAIVEAHGGRVSVSSQPGHGSAFTVAFPTSGTSPAAADAPVPTATLAS
jgi:signal transduction histidine kinase